MGKIWENGSISSEIRLEILHPLKNSRTLTFKEGADLLQRGEIAFQLYACFPMGFIGWPNLFM